MLTLLASDSTRILILVFHNLCSAEIELFEVFAGHHDSGPGFIFVGIRMVCACKAFFDALNYYHPSTRVSGKRLITGSS